MTERGETAVAQVEAAANADTEVEAAAEIEDVEAAIAAVAAEIEDVEAAVAELKAELKAAAETEEVEAAAAEAAAEPAADEHPLSCSWTLWLKFNRTSHDDFQSKFKRIGTFSTVERIWALLGYLETHMSTFGDATNIALFREGIKPVWEDKHNAEGGQVPIEMDKNAGAVYKTFETLVCTLAHLLRLNATFAVTLCFVLFCVGDSAWPWWGTSLARCQRT